MQTMYTYTGSRTHTLDVVCRFVSCTSAYIVLLRTSEVKDDTVLG